MQAWLLELCLGLGRTSFKDAVFGQFQTWQNPKLWKKSYLRKVKQGSHLRLQSDQYTKVEAFTFSSALTWLSGYSSYVNLIQTAYQTSRVPRCSCFYYLYAQIFCREWQPGSKISCALQTLRVYLHSTIEVLRQKVLFFHDAHLSSILRDCLSFILFQSLLNHHDHRPSLLLFSSSFQLTDRALMMDRCECQRQSTTTDLSIPY